MEIHFTGSYEKKLYYKSVSLAHRPTKLSAVLRISGVALLLILYLAMVVDVFQQESRSTSDYTHLLSYLLTIVVLSSMILKPYINAFVTSRNAWKNPITHQPILGVVSNSGIRFGTRSTAPSIKWEAFTKLEKTENLIVLVTIDLGMVILPRSFFQSDSDWETLQQWIERYVKAAN